MSSITFSGSGSGSGSGSCSCNSSSSSSSNSAAKWTVASFADVRKSAPVMLKIMSFVMKIISQSCKPYKHIWGAYLWTSHWFMHKFIASITASTGGCNYHIVSVVCCCIFLAGKTEFFFIKIDNLLATCKSVFWKFAQENERFLYDLDASAQLCYENGFPTSADVFEVEMRMLATIGFDFHRVGSPLRSLRTIGRRLSSDTARRSIGVAYCIEERDSESTSKSPSVCAFGVTPEKKTNKAKFYADFKVKDSKKLEQQLLEIFSALEESKVRVGDQVEVISSSWTAGIASSEQGNETFCVEYNDGRIEEYVHEDRIRKNHSLYKTPGFICSKEGICTSSFRNKYFRHLNEAARRLQKQSKYPNLKEILQHIINACGLYLNDITLDLISSSNSPKTPAFAGSDVIILGPRSRSDSLQSDIPEPESPNTPLEGGIASISRCISTSPSTALEVANENSSKTRHLTTTDTCISFKETAEHIEILTHKSSVSEEKTTPTPELDSITSLGHKKIRMDERLSVPLLQQQPNGLQIGPTYIVNDKRDGEGGENNKKSDQGVSSDNRSIETEKREVCDRQPRNRNRLLELLTPSGKSSSGSIEREKKPEGLSKLQGGGAVRMLNKALSAITKKK